MIPKLPHHLLEDILEEIRIFVENIIESIGVHGHSVPVLRHVLLTLVAILLAFIAERICKYLFVPLVLRLVKRTQARWDDVVLDHQSAAHSLPHCPCLGDMAVDAACLLSVPCRSGGFDTANCRLSYHSNDATCDETHRPPALSQHENPVTRRVFILSLSVAY